MKCSHFFRFIKFKYILPWTDMLLSPIFEMSKFLVTQINIRDNLKLLQKTDNLWTVTLQKSNHTEKHLLHIMHLLIMLEFLFNDHNWAKIKTKKVYLSAASVHLSFFLVFFLGAGDQTQGLAHAKHVLYHWALPPAKCAPF